MKEILQALKILLILALYPLYFIGDAYESFFKYDWSLLYYLDQSWYKMILTIIWVLVFFFGVL